MALEKMRQEEASTLERLSKIQETIATLEDLVETENDTEAESTKPTAKRIPRSKPQKAAPITTKRISRTKPVVKNAAKKSVATKKTGKDTLPSTGSEFWLSLLSEPVTNEQVMSAALATPDFKGIKMTPKMMEKLRGRWSNFSSQSGKDKVTKDGRGSSATFVRKA
jgi:hypothetical protein